MVNMENLVNRIVWENKKSKASTVDVREDFKFSRVSTPSSRAGRNITPRDSHSQGIIKDKIGVHRWAARDRYINASDRNEAMRETLENAKSCLKSSTENVEASKKLQDSLQNKYNEIDCLRIISEEYNFLVVFDIGLSMEERSVMS